jgi:hypothetical protein
LDGGENISGVRAAGVEEDDRVIDLERPGLQEKRRGCRRRWLAGRVDVQSSVGDNRRQPGSSLARYAAAACSEEGQRAIDEGEKQKNGGVGRE